MRCLAAGLLAKWRSDRASESTEGDPHVGSDPIAECVRKDLACARSGSAVDVTMSCSESVHLLRDPKR